MAVSAEAVTKTRERIHRAAVGLFTKKGFHGTGMREIAATAGVSLGNLYNHHQTKKALFSALLEGFEVAYTGDGTPIARALAAFRTLDDLEALGEASRKTVRRFADYIRLIYVDVVEHEGEHIRRLFDGMRRRYQEALGPRLEELVRTGELRDDVDPVAGLMTATISYFYLFNMRQLFGVRRLYGTSDQAAIGTIATLLRDGMRPR